MGGGAHREGWGMGLADGHVISEYGSPGAYHVEKSTKKRSNIRRDEGERVMKSRYRAFLSDLSI